MEQNDLVTTWSVQVLDALAASLSAFLSYLPNLVGATVIFIIGWIVAGIVKKIVIRILDVLQLEPFAAKVGISQALQRAGTVITPSELLGEIIRWSVVLVFLNPTVEILGLSEVTEIINSILLYIPNVIIAALILMFGLIFADLTGHFIKGTAAALGTGTANSLGTITRYAIYVFVMLAALSQLGIAQQLINTLFTGFVAMIAIAGGLAFGLGGKELAQDILVGFKINLQEKNNADQSNENQDKESNEA